MFIVYQTSMSCCTLKYQELSACKWMPIEEYRTHELVHNTNRYFINQYLKCRHGNILIINLVSTSE